MESPRFGRSGSGRKSSIQVPVSDMPIKPNPNRMLSRNTSQMVARGSSGLDTYSDENEQDHQDDSNDGGDGGGKTGSMSLMALLAETDKEMGLDGAMYMMDDDDLDKDDEEEEEVIENDELSNCSVCMVKHKGDALTACGHTFCRLCSRELFIEKGNCPLCNNFILEILDVF